MDGHWKILLQETEAHVETLKSLKDEVTRLKQTLCDSFKWTMQNMLKIRERVIEQARGFFPDAII